MCLVLSLVVCAAARPVLAQIPECSGPDDPVASGLYAARETFNQAIAEKNITAIRAVLAEDALLVTGTDSIVFKGRSEQAATWQEDFDASERAIYVRETTCVSLSPLLPIALESGTWRGVMTDNADNFAAGSYSAKWRKIDGRWQIEAEIFATERCGGTFCPEPAAAANEIETVQSWEHYRELMIQDGDSEAEADRQVSRLLASLGSMDRSAGEDRIGVPAPSFDFDGWLNSQPLSLEDLRGRVVLVRWWTETCPFCASSAPALRALNDQYGPQGLTVIGVYHPKADRDGPLDIARVERAVAARELDFPVAIDWDWRNGVLADWWLTGPDRPATSVTFLLDKSGVIQFIHPGMEYHAADQFVGEYVGEPEVHEMCAADMLGIRTEIERLLAE